MSKNQILNIPSIQDNVSKRHRLFMKEFGSASDKVMADHALFADMVVAKLNRIVLIFKEEGVINSIETTENGPYKNIRLSKEGTATYVNVVTNGLVIVLEGFTYTTGFDTNFKWPSERFFAVNNADFDWEDFTTKLLDYIHATIYERKEAIETRLNGMFQSFLPDIKVTRKSKKKSL